MDNSIVIYVVLIVAVLIGTFSLLSLLSQRNTRTVERLERHSRPASLAELEMPDKKMDEQRFTGVKKAMEDIGGVLKPKSELEQSEVKIRLANAGFRSEAAPGIFQGMRMISLITFTGIGALVFLVAKAEVFPFQQKPWIWFAFTMCLGFYLPSLVLGYLRKKRQEAIFLTLPDALDLLVVCVESGLGLDQAMRRVTEEMKDHAKVICEELALANFQLQMGRPRREVLHDLGVRTGVDDVRSLAAILIQADRFGSSIAQALRVQSDSMRTRRRQLAEEKAAKTAVQLIFPLVLFIFPGIFIVLVGPAAIQIGKEMGSPK